MINNNLVFQMLMSVLPTHVKMVVFVLMESMDTHVSVQLAGLVSTVISVSTTINAV